MIQVQDMRSILQILRSCENKIYSQEELRLDMIENAFKREAKVCYDSEFDLKSLRKKRQGWTRNIVIEMINQINRHFGVKEIRDLNEFDLDNYSKKQLLELKDSIPPIIVFKFPEVPEFAQEKSEGSGIFGKIVSVAPNQTENSNLKLEDGNHRVGVLETFFKIGNCKAFILE